LQDSWDAPVSAEKGTLYYIQELGGERELVQPPWAAESKRRKNEWQNE